MEIIAKETPYKGVMFRSRLEAQAAYYLDFLGFKWLYEPHTIKLSDGRLYVPDFYLYELDNYIEVKGAHNERIDKFKLFEQDKEGCFLLTELGFANEDDLCLYECRECGFRQLTRIIDWYSCLKCGMDDNPGIADYLNRDIPFIEVRNEISRYDKRISPPEYLYREY